MIRVRRLAGNSIATKMRHISSKAWSSDLIFTKWGREPRLCHPSVASCLRISMFAHALIEDRMSAFPALAFPALPGLLRLKNQYFLRRAFDRRLREWKRARRDVAPIVELVLPVRTVR